MKRLYDLVTLVTNTEECVVLKVKPDSTVDLVCLGCFDGDETMFRLTKGSDQTCTVWTARGTCYSWEWGDHGYTCVSSNQTKRGKMIQYCIEDDFDIRIHGSKETIKKDMHWPCHTHIIKLYSNGSIGICCHKDNEFLRYFKTADEALTCFKNAGYTIQAKDTGVYRIYKSKESLCK